MGEAVRQRRFGGPRRVPCARVFDTTADAFEVHSLPSITAPSQSPITQERMTKFASMARLRQRGLVLVLVDPDRLEAAAMLRSCDAFGVAEVHFIFETTNPFDPLANRQVYKSEGSNLWVCSRVFKSVTDCVSHLTTKQYTSALITGLHGCSGADGTSIFQTTLSQYERLALWVCNYDSKLPGPLANTVASLRVCVSVALDEDGPSIVNAVSMILAEVVRQRQADALEANSPDKWRLSQSEQKSVIDWCVAVYCKRHPSSATSEVEDGEHGNDTTRPEYRKMASLREELARQGW